MAAVMNSTELPAEAVTSAGNLLARMNHGWIPANDADMARYEATAKSLLEAAAPHMTPGVVWLVRDPATCTACSCPGDVTAVFPTEPEAAGFTARLPRRGLVIEKWPVPGHE